MLFQILNKLYFREVLGTQKIEQKVQTVLLYPFISPKHNLFPLLTPSTIVVYLLQHNLIINP